MKSNMPSGCRCCTTMAFEVRIHVSVCQVYLLMSLSLFCFVCGAPRLEHAEIDSQHYHEHTTSLVAKVVSLARAWDILGRFVRYQFQHGCGRRRRDAANSEERRGGKEWVRTWRSGGA